MANSLFDKGRESFLGQNPALDWDTDTIKIVLVDSGYTINLATHQYLSDIPSGNRVATSGALTTKTVTAGVADADDVTFTAATGNQVVKVVFYKDTGTTTTSPLIGCIDTATGLPVTPNGGNIVIAFDSGANKIFKL